MVVNSPVYVGYKGDRQDRLFSLYQKDISWANLSVR